MKIFNETTVEKLGLSDELINKASGVCTKCNERFEPTTTMCPKCNTETVYSKYISLKYEIDNLNQLTKKRDLYTLGGILITGIYLLLLYLGCFDFVNFNNATIFIAPVLVLGIVEKLIFKNLSDGITFTMKRVDEKLKEIQADMQTIAQKNL